MQRKIPVIHDGDHGTDDVTCTLFLLSQPQHINLLGITTCQGNVPVDMATHNALRTVTWSGHIDVPVFQGLADPIERKRPYGDDAHGADGLGGAKLPQPSICVQKTPALDWLQSTFENTDQKITILATGPLTNVAALLKRAPHVVQHIERLIIMGGSLRPLAANFTRCGNITPFAEFNFYMDPEAADFVLSVQNLDITLFGLDVTHQMGITQQRQKYILEHFPASTREEFLKLMTATARLDQPAFECDGSYHHDTLTALYLMKPDLFTHETLRLKVECHDEERTGQCIMVDDTTRPPLTWINGFTDADAAFDQILDALKVSIPV